MKIPLAIEGVINKVLHNRYWQLIASQGLTVRGLTLLLFIAYLALDPVSNRSDIISAVATLGLGGVIVLLFGTTILHGSLLKRAFHASVYFPQSSELMRIEARVPIIVVLKTSGIRILPLYLLEIDITWQHEEIETPQINLTGSKLKPRTITFPVTFPHRGNWRLHSIKCTLVDRLGLTHKSWSVSESVTNSQIEVQSPQVNFSDLPILSSSHRAGDSAPDLNNRSGELFDIKQYHPSDGAKRILWKVFARRGELLSRHPEPSFTPEGQVALFCMARTHDDHVASNFLAYLNRLEELQLDIYAGCQGMGDSTVARNKSSAAQLLINSTWNASQANSDSILVEIDKILESLTSLNQQSLISKCIIFIAEERFTTEKSCQEIEAIGRALSIRKIQPVYCVCSQQITPDMGSIAPRTWTTSIQGLFIIREQPNMEFEATSNFYPQFLSKCVSYDWPVLVVNR